MNYATDPIFIGNFRKVAILFLTRDNGFNYLDANREVDMIMSPRLGLEKFIASSKAGGKFENEAYVFMNRTGAAKPLNRAERVSIALSLNSAINHALFECGEYE